MSNIILATQVRIRIQNLNWKWRIWSWSDLQSLSIYPVKRQCWLRIRCFQNEWWKHYFNRFRINGINPVKYWLRIEQCINSLSLNFMYGVYKVFHKKYLKEDLFMWWPMEKTLILLHIRAVFYSLFSLRNPNHMRKKTNFTTSKTQILLHFDGSNM